MKKEMKNITDDVKEVQKDVGRIDGYVERKVRFKMIIVIARKNQTKKE